MIYETSMCDSAEGCPKLTLGHVEPFVEQIIFEGKAGLEVCDSARRQREIAIAGAAGYQTFKVGRTTNSCGLKSRNLGRQAGLDSPREQSIRLSPRFGGVQTRQSRIHSLQITALWQHSIVISFILLHTRPVVGVGPFDRVPG